MRGKITLTRARNLQKGVILNLNPPINNVNIELTSRMWRSSATDTGPGILSTQ